MNKILYIFFLSALTLLTAQNFEREINSISIEVNSLELNNTFSGGVNNPEFQFVDIDGDSDADLLYFCSDGSFEWLENKGSAASFNFELTLQEIPGLALKNWFFFTDIDADGDYDYFTGGSANTVQYYKNVGTAAFPNFRLEIDTLKNVNGEIVFSESVSNPTFADVDADGDYDFISGNQAGTVSFYENTGTPQNLILDTLNTRWQGLVIIGGKSAERHGASSLEFGDLDGDNDLDLLWGDFFSRSLYFIRNNGTAQIPNMQLESNIYPVNQDSLLTRGFNMPRLFDLDSDSDLDLFASVLYDPTVPQSIIYYKNEGSSSAPAFVKITSDLLFTLDVGTKSIPALVDIDADDDLDLFIGAENNPFGTIFRFENTGSNIIPAFVLRDSMFAEIMFDLSVAPAFGDIDNDGDYDLLVGKFLGEIAYYENIGNTQFPNFQYRAELKDGSGTVIKLSNFIRPELVDVDFDNDLDLVLGAFNGEVILYRNNGTSANFIFQKDENYFSSIDVGDQSSPAMIDEDNDGDLDLFVGTREGIIKFFRNIGNLQNPNFQLISNDYFSFDFGGEASPLFWDADLDGDYDLIAGNIKGGLYFMRNKLISGIDNSDVSILPETINLQISAYPNPFNGIINIQIETKFYGFHSIELYNVAGQKVVEIFKGYLNKGELKLNWNANTLSSGSYMVVIKNKNTLAAKKIIHLK